MAAKRTRKTAQTSLPRGTKPPRTVTRDLYLVWRSPRIGQGNPHRFPSPVWNWLASQTELSAYQANAYFQGPSSLAVGPAWCNMRFGQTRTELPGGRVVRIAGEHEDYYDPDFFIYSDVIVEDPSGGITIYGYPQDVFPPTDNHSATLAGDDVFVIGNLGYIHRRRPAETPVVRLDTKTFAMHPVATQGAPPGGIRHHTATLSADGGAIVVTGGQRTVVTGDRFNLVQSPDDWRLDLQTLVWKRLTDRRWEQWELRRTDGKGNELWKRDMAYRYGREDKPIDKWTFEGLGDPATVWANRGLHETRYSPPMAHEVLPEQEGVPLVLRRVVEGVVVRYVEDSYAVEVIVEGVLPAAVLETILDDACKKLGELEGVGYAKSRVA